MGSQFLSKEENATPIFQSFVILGVFSTFQNLLMGIVGSLTYLVMQTLINKSLPESESKPTEVKHELFPTISNENIDNSLGFQNPTLCSTSEYTHYSMFQNEKGEVEWQVSDDKAFQPYLTDENVNLSPSLSNSSKDSIISNTFKAKFEKDDTPMSLNLSPSSSDEAEKKAEFGVDNEFESDGKVHQCPHCLTVFKIRGYLTRHMKKHADKKAYTCPYQKFSTFVDENNVTHKCHPTGGFSRRDTYKTHLKTRHFDYPKGTKTKERALTAGNCSVCGEYFENAEMWVEMHVEGGECRYLPPGFKGKSRIKNRLLREMSKRRKEKDTRELKELKASSQEFMNFATPILETPQPSNYRSPTQVNFIASNYPARPASNSPTFSVSSSGNINSGVSVTLMSNDSPVHPQPFNQVKSNYMAYNEIQPPPIQPQFLPVNHHDYDDEYCLDVEQLQNPNIGVTDELMNYLASVMDPNVHVSYPQQSGY